MIDRQRQLIHNFFQVEQKRRDEEIRIDAHRKQAEKSAQQNLSRVRTQAEPKLRSETQSLEQVKQRSLNQGESWLQEAEHLQNDSWDQLKMAKMTHLVGINVQASPPANTGVLAPKHMLERSWDDVHQLASKLDKEVKNLITWRKRHDFRQRSLLAGIAVILVVASLIAFFLYREYPKIRLYRSAKAFLGDEEWLQAMEQFQMLLKKAPNYRDAGEMLQESKRLSEIATHQIIGRDGAPMALIPAGEFSMGDHQGYGLDSEKPVHTVYLDNYYIDVYEITNARYARFLNEYGRNEDTAGHRLINIGSGSCLIEEIGGIHRSKVGYENRPVVEVSWYGAAAYAQFYSKCLPTEAEWEKAARGGLVSKKYPWGDEDNQSNLYFHGVRSKDDLRSGIFAVGSFLPNSYALYDIAGNVWEWCADEYDPDYYRRSPKSDPMGPGIMIAFIDDDFSEVNTSRSLRGGSDKISDLRVACRHSSMPIHRDALIGFRCVERQIRPEKPNMEQKEQEDHVYDKSEIHEEKADNHKTYAYLELQSVKPWAHVYIDNRRVAITPVGKPIQVEMGKHQIKLENPETGGVWQTEHSFAENEIFSVPPVDLGTYAYLKIRLVKPWADVYLDGKKIDTTPISEPIVLQPGYHSIRLENPITGKKWQEDHNFKKDETYVLDKIDLR